MGICCMGMMVICPHTFSHTEYVIVFLLASNTLKIYERITIEQYKDTLIIQLSQGIVKAVEAVKVL